MAKLTVTKDEINVTLSDQEIEQILTAHVTTWLERYMSNYVHDSVELSDHIETNLQQRGRGMNAEISFQRNEITDEQHEIDIMS